MALIDELYAPPIQTACFAYCKDTESCTACTELLCMELGRKCPFFKTKAKLEEENMCSARKLLDKMQSDDVLRIKLKMLGITESDLRKKAVEKDGSQ